MPPPNQPDLPPISPWIGAAASSIPMFNTSMGMPSGFHQPYMAPPGTYAVPPPSAHGGPSMFGDIFSGGRYQQNPGNSGYQAAQGIPFFAGNNLSSMGLNAVANMGLQAAAGMIPGGEAIAQGMLPFGGLQTSRMDFLRMRERQNITNNMFSMKDGAWAANPALELLGTAGFASNSFVQMATGSLTGFKTRFEAFNSNLGRAFGGTELDKQKGVFQAMNALEISSTLAGGGLDWNMTQGMDRKEMMESITSSYRRGAFVTGKDFQDLSSAVAGGDVAGAKKLGQKMTSEIADVMATGRDVFGQDASEDDIISGIENVFGHSGITDAGQASQRLRQIEAMGQVLNMDSKVVAEYMQVMKQLTRNVGLVSSAGTNASVGMMMSGEVASRYGDQKGINVDKEAVMSDRVTSMERNLNSSDAKQKEALIATLRSTQADVLSDISLGKINGKETSALEARNYINKQLSRDDLTGAERRELESFMGTAKERLNGNTTEMGRNVAGRYRELSANGKDEFINMINSQLGETGYKEFVFKSGVNQADMDRSDRIGKRLAEELGKGGVEGSDIIRKSGGASKFLDRVKKSGYFDASFSGDNKAAIANLRGEFSKESGVSDKQFASMVQGLGLGLRETQIYEGESYQEILGSLAADSRQDNAGNIKPNLRAEERALEAFSKISGGMPIGSKQLGKRGLQALMREINRTGGKFDGDTLKNLFKDTMNSEQIGAFQDLMSGKVKSTVDGKETSFMDLQGKVEGVLSQKGLTKEQRDAKIGDLTAQFWKGIDDKSNIGKILRPSGEENDAGPESEPGHTKEQKDNILGTDLAAVITGLASSAGSKIDELIKILEGIAKGLGLSPVNSEKQ